MKSSLDKPRAAEPPPGFWSGELGYPQAILILCTAFVIGLFYQSRMPGGVQFPPALAWTAGVAFLVVIGFVSVHYRETHFMQWLTGIPYAIVSTVAVGLVAGAGAVIPAETLQARYGMESVYSSWPFAMVMLAMMVNLIGVAARRLFPLSYRNFCFSLNHLGLAVAVLGGAMSAASLERARMVLEVGTPVSRAETDAGQTLEMPFTATLKEFTLESFPPVLVVAREDASVEGGMEMKRGTTFLKPGISETIDGYTVKVSDYHAQAAYVGGAWKGIPGLKGAPPAARVTVTGPSGRKAGEGWVSSGGVVAMGDHVIPIEPGVVTLDDGRLVGMMPPTPREYRSEVVFKQDGSEETRLIRVNKPISVGDYRLYQVSYDEEMGAASTASVIEAVRDPGLPVVYAGLYLMLAGAAFMLWNGVGTGVTLKSPTLPEARPEHEKEEVTA